MADSSGAPRGQADALELEDVLLVAAVDRLPDAAARWPVRVLRAADCPPGARHVYLCGAAADVAGLARAGGAFAEGSLLGLLVDDEAALAGLLADSGPAAAVDVVPGLRGGFTDESWEAAVAAVCSKHVATVQAMVLRHARLTPDKVALIFEDRQWTFQQVVSMSSSLVERLREMGLEPKAGPLAVQLTQSDRTIFVYLGLYSARWQFQIVDANPVNRAFRLEACPSIALLCESGAEPDASIRAVFVDELQLDSSKPVAEIKFEGELEDVAFIEYTSGSTGRPKSVATKQFAIAHWVRWRQFHFPLLEGNDRVAYNLFFIWYFHITLCQGGVTVVYPPALNHDVSALMSYLDKHKVNRCDCLTPGLISALLEVETSLPASMKTMISGGEALPLGTCREWLRRWPHVEFLNNYALTEAAADISFCRITDKVANMDLLYAPITDGIIAWNNELQTIDEELVMVGWNIAERYLPPTVSEVFTPSDDGKRNRYRTGDRARWVDGKLFLFGRVDSVVKIRGHRVDLTGLEAMIGACDAAKDLACVSWQDSVWAVVVTEDLKAVQQFAQREVPQADLIVWRRWPELPYTHSGKRDRKKIEKMLEEFKENEVVNEDSLPGGAPITDEERRVAAAWATVLGRAVGRTEPFQQAGGHSLAAMRLAKQLGISPAEVFAYPTVAAMAARLADPAAEVGAKPAFVPHQRRVEPNAPVAVVGLAARLPGAHTTAAFWEALEAGRDLISDLPAGPDHVPRKGKVPDQGMDCNFWGIPKEIASTLDTAQRTLLELAYEVLEDAGLDPFNVRGRVGVVVCGGSLPHYATDTLGINLEECRVERPDEYFALEIGTDKDYLATQISFRLNLHGPSEVVQTACSSGLVAVVRGVQMLRLGICDYVICGGASFSPDAAVRKVDGMIWSSDGICRPFAEGANGTVNSDGAGAILLTNLIAAEERGERIYSTIRGAATNNDGARKAGYSAPSMEGQVEVIQAALADAGLGGSDVDYVEAHGTGTKLGDPLEVQALTKALGSGREIALGSVKGNIGHTNTVAGIPGFMKASLMLFHQRKVPSLHARHPSKIIDWEKTCLRLVEAAGDWKGSVVALSSFGIGGTNAHVILGAPPVKSTQGPRAPRAWQRDALPSAHGAGQRAPGGVMKAQVAAAVSNAHKTEGIAGLFYESQLTRVEVSCLELSEAAVIVDGDASTVSLPPGWVVATHDRAISAARACGGNLVFMGVGTTMPTLDDTSQEDLLLRATALIASLARSTRDGIEVFFVLSSGVRYAGLWGLLRVAAREHPEVRLRRLLREDGAPLLFPAMPAELVLKADGAYAPRLRATPPPPPPPGGPPTYRKGLVTGGLRGLGVKVAEWLVASGRVSSLVLVGRSAARGEAADAIDRLKKSVPVEVLNCDVAEWAQVEKLPDCDLVVHCAGAVRDGVLINLTEKDARQVLRPKIRGAWHLKTRFPKARLLAFSSSSGLFGVAGQGTYAAANTFVDAIVPAVQWGGWGETGMVTELGVEELPGERFMPVSQGLECLGRVLDGPESLQPLCVVDVDWETFRQNSTVFSVDDPLLADIDAPSLQPPLLGAPRDIGDDGHARSWDLVLGAAGTRWRGSSPSWEVCQQHVVGGVPIFPATAYVALAVEAAKQAIGSAQVVLTDISFLRPLELAAPRKVTVTLVRSGVGGSLRITSRPLHEDGMVTLHCTCDFAPASDHRLECTAPVGLPVVEGLYARFAASGFHYGPSFRASKVCCDATRGRCDLPEQPGSPFSIHPASLDSAMHLGSLLHPLGCRGVPQSIRRLTVGSSSAAASACAALEAGQLDFQVLDRSGKVVCKVEGLGITVLDAAAQLQVRRQAWKPYPAESRTGVWLTSGSEAIALGLPQTTTKLDDEHDATVLAVRAETLEDVWRCREDARRIVAHGPCWVVALDSAYAEAAAAAAAEVGAQAVIGSAEDVRAVAAELGGRAPVLRCKGGALLARGLESAEDPQQIIASRTEPYVVTMDPSRAAKGVQCRLSQRRSPAQHEVELRTSLWALNFRDVLVAVGAISTEVAGQSLGIGGECYGEVVSVGSEVTGLAVGDKVIAVPPDGMGSYANIDARWVTRAPSMSPAEAVSGTCVYATAWLGLRWIARIARGDRVLIHSAAGGVGLAAVHLSLRAGCTVYATASTAEKRALLTSLGVSAVFDSRNVAAFEEGVREATGGEGVDVVLNSLSGEAIPASLRLLRPFGRFIEIGKRDQYEDTRIGLNPFLAGLTYAAAHFDVLMLRQPDRCRQLLEEVWAELPDLPKLPFSTFQISELPKALEYFSKGVHVGKILVELDDTPALPARPSAVAGPVGDEVTQALRIALGAEAGPGGVVCVPSLKALANVEDLQAAQVVISASPAVIAIAEAVCPKAIRVELPRWEPFVGFDDWLSLGGHVVAVEEEAGGDLREWLLEVVEEMAGPIEMEETFESTGLDSLSLISLARRLSAKVGKSVSVADLYDNPTPQKLLDSFSGRAQPQLVRPKVLCLHGFRSNKDAMALQMSPLTSAFGMVEWVFVNSPRRATGPAAPKIPTSEAFEWWGQRDGPYETGWLGSTSQYDGLEETLALVKAMSPVGVVGFSQGGAVAALLEARWVALFSAVTPKALRRRDVHSFHSWDAAEEYVSQCIEVSEHFANKQVHQHTEGHNVPRDPAVVERFVAFASALMP